MDTLTKEARSRLMSRIRSTGNLTTEVAMARLLRAAGLRGWRRHLGLPGRPDFAWRRERVALFVHGCFWHHHFHAKVPKSKFWRDKIRANRARDKRVVKELQSAGWTVFTVWECDLQEHVKRHGFRWSMAAVFTSFIPRRVA